MKKTAFSGAPRIAAVIADPCTANWISPLTNAGTETVARMTTIFKSTPSLARKPLARAIWR